MTYHFEPEMLLCVIILTLKQEFIMADAKYIADTIEKVNKLKDKLSRTFETICAVVDRLDVLKEVSVTLKYEAILNRLADYYYFNSSYNAYETYSDIEEFKYALKEEEMVELAEKFSKDGSVFNIGILFYEDFEYRTAMGWAGAAFHAKMLSSLTEYVNAVNPKMFEPTVSTESFTDFDAFALYTFYKDAYFDMDSKLDAVCGRAAEVKSSVSFFVDNTANHHSKDEIRLAYAKAISDNNVLRVIDEIIALNSKD